MKKLLLIIFSLLILVGCSTIISDNKNDSQKRMAAKTESIQNTKNQIAYNTEEKLNQVSGLSYGVGYSLNNISFTNKIVEVETAKDLNSRIISIAGSPNLDEMNRIKQTVDLLNSEISKERIKGAKLLSDKDKEILEIQNEKNNLKEVLEKRIEELTKAAKKQAEENDSNNVIIDNVNKWFGLGAVFYGLKRFLTSCIVGILIFGVIFLILRLLAATNPIASSIFSVFNIIGASVVQVVKGLAPKSLNFGGFSPSSEVEKYKSTLLKLIDNIEEIQIMETDGKPITIDDLLTHFNKEFDQTDKDIIKELKTTLRWKH